MDFRFHRLENYTIFVSHFSRPSLVTSVSARPGCGVVCGVPPYVAAPRLVERPQRTAHLGAPAFIHCHTTTTNDKSDASQLADLLNQLTPTTMQPVAEACLDGVYDSAARIDGLLDRDIRPIIPPQRGAGKWYRLEPGDLAEYPRNVAIRRIDEIGQAEWKKEVGYHRRSLSETAMYRYKTIFGPQHYSGSLSTQVQENKMKVKAVNHMTAHGMPSSKPKAA